MAGDATPSVEFELELADYQATLRYLASWRSAGGLARVGRMLAGLVGGFLLTLAAPPLRRDPFAFAAGLFVGFLLIPVSVLIARKHVQAPGRAVLCRYRFQLDEAGVHVETPLWNTTFSWAGILAVDETPTYCFLRTDTTRGYAIPKRAFADATAEVQFVSFARACVARAHPASPG